MFSQNGPLSNSHSFIKAKLWSATRCLLLLSVDNTYFGPAPPPLLRPKHWCHFKQLGACLSKQKYWIFWQCIITSYLWGGPPCTYCPNLRSKFHHLAPKQPSNGLPFHSCCVVDTGLRQNTYTCIVAPFVSQRKFCFVVSQVGNPPSMAQNCNVSIDWLMSNFKHSL